MSLLDYYNNTILRRSQSLRHTPNAIPLARGAQPKLGSLKALLGVSDSRPQTPHKLEAMFLEHWDGDGEGLPNLELAERISLACTLLIRFNRIVRNLEKLRHLFSSQIPLYYPKG